MSSSIETYEPKFRPMLRQFAAGSKIADYIEAYKIANKSYPAPTLNGNKAAYWIATPTTPDDVLPILAISIPASKRIIDVGYYWSIGAASRNDIAVRSEVIKQEGLSVQPLGAAVLEFATSGPYVHHEAFENIQLLCPMPKGIMRH